MHFFAEYLPFPVEIGSDASDFEWVGIGTGCSLASKRKQAMAFTKDNPVQNTHVYDIFETKFSLILHIKCFVRLRVLVPSRFK